MLYLSYSRDLATMRNFSWLVAALVATGVAVPVNNDNSIEWGSCPDSWTSSVALSAPGAANNSASLRCANYTVPMDWDHPDGVQTVRLGISKLVAKKPEVRRSPQNIGRNWRAELINFLEADWQPFLQPRWPRSTGGP